jgi:hypothetical protein
MKVGTSTPIRARLVLVSAAPAEVAKVGANLIQGLPQAAPAPVRVSQRMRVVLSGKSDEFRIEHDSEDSPDGQLVGSSEYTE